MAHLACLAHKRRVIVIVGPKVINAYHRTSGEFCVSSPVGSLLADEQLVIGGNKLSLLDVCYRHGNPDGFGVKAAAARTARHRKALSGAVALSERKPRRRPGRSR